MVKYHIVFCYSYAMASPVVWRVVGVRQVCGGGAGAWLLTFVLVYWMLAFAKQDVRLRDATNCR